MARVWGGVWGFAIAAAIALGLSTLAEAADVSRPAAWAIGDNLSLAALLYEHGAAQEMIDKSLGKAKAAADVVGVEIKPFLPRGKSNAETGAAVIHYLVKGDGWATGEQLQKKYGKDQGTLFELAVKSNLAILLYQPGDDSGLANIIKTRSEAVHLPPPLWTPVVAAMNDKKSQDEIKRAVFKMHDDITTELMKDVK